MNKKQTNQRYTSRNSKLLRRMTFQQVEIPDYSEKVITGQSFVRWGADNKFPEFLQSLMNRSAVHNAIIMSKTRNSFGKGLVISEDMKDILTKAFCKHPNPTQTMDELYKRLLFDYVLYGCAAINVIWDADGQHIAEIYHIDVGKIRSGKKDMRGNVDTYFYSDNWNRGCKNYVEIPSFNPAHPIGSQLLFISDYRPGTEYYSLPSYCGALTDIATDIEISNFHLSHLKNGMNPSKMITFTDGVPSDEEEQELIENIQDTYSGTDNAGRMLINFVDSQDRTPVVETLGGDNLGDEFIQLENSTINKILAGHQVTSPLLVGLRGDNGLGNNANEILEAFNLFISSVIRPIQDVILKELNTLLSYTRGYEGMELEATVNSPVDFVLSEATLLRILTKDELRELIGKEKLTEEQRKELEKYE